MILLSNNFLNPKIQNMKKVFFAVIITFMIAGCNQPEKKEDTVSNKNTEMKTLYEKNLSTVKHLLLILKKKIPMAWLL